MRVGWSRAIHRSEATVRAGAPRQTGWLRILVAFGLALTTGLVGTVVPAAGAALTLFVLVQPASAFPLAPFATQPVIGFSMPTTNPGIGNGLSAQLADSAGAPIFGGGIAQLSMGGPCLNNKWVVGVPFASTQMAFNGLSVDKAGTYRLIFTLEPGGDDIAFGAVTSNSFLVGTGAAAQLRTKGAVTGAAKTRPLNQLRVELDDAGANTLVTDNTDSISLQLLDAVSLNPPTNGGTLQGASRATVANGIASFSGLSIGSNGDFVLRATATAPVPPLDIRGPNYSTSPVAPGTAVFVRDRQLVISSSPTSGRAGQPIDALTCN